MDLPKSAFQTGVESIITNCSFASAYHQLLASVVWPGVAGGAYMGLDADSGMREHARSGPIVASNMLSQQPHSSQALVLFNVGADYSTRAMEEIGVPLSLSDVDDDDAAFFGPTTEDEDRAFFEAPATADDDEFFDAACDEDDAAAAAGWEDADDDWDADDAAWAALAPEADGERTPPPSPRPPSHPPAPARSPSPPPPAFRRSPRPKKRDAAPRESRDSVRLALAERRVADVATRCAAVRAEAARCAAPDASSAGREGGDPLATYADLEAALGDLRSALRDATASTRAFAETAKRPTSLNELERDLRAAAGELLSGDGSVEGKLDALDAAIKQHPDHALRLEEREAIWDGAFPFRAFPRSTSRFLRRPRAREERRGARDDAQAPAPGHQLVDGDGRARALRAVHRRDRRGRGAREARVGHRGALARLAAPGPPQARPPRGPQEPRGAGVSWLSPQNPIVFFVGYNVNGLDILELRAVYAAVRDVAFDNDPRGDKAAWRANARRKLAELVDKERKGALLPNEARRPEYRHVGAFDLELPAPPHVDDDARARASTAA